MKKYYYSTGELSDVIKYEDLELSKERTYHIWKDKNREEIDILNYGKQEVEMDRNKFGFSFIRVYCVESTENYMIFRNIKEFRNGIICLFKNLSAIFNLDNQEIITKSNEEVERLIDALDSIDESLSLEEIIFSLNSLKLQLDDGNISASLKKTEFINLNEEFGYMNCEDPYTFIVRKPTDYEIESKQGCSEDLYESDQPNSYILNFVQSKLKVRLSFGKIKCYESSYSELTSHEPENQLGMDEFRY